jgi:AhpD family alkylhydroperoxidase
MKNPALVVPEALKALQALGQTVHDAPKRGEFEEKLLHLVFLRASQINGCSVCVDMHALDAKKAGESDQRLWGVAAWRDSPFFSDQERAALALTEALTRIADQADPVNDQIWNEATKHFAEAGLASLVLAIAQINLWNRLNCATRQIAGAWR